MASLELQKEIEKLTVYIPEEMDPGTMFTFDEHHSNPNWPHSPYVGVFSCPVPRCALIGLITRAQAAGLHYMICGSKHCSAEYRFKQRGDGEVDIEFRKPM